MKYSRIGIVLTVAAMVTGCVSFTPVYYEDDKAVAIKAVERVHELFNDGNPEEIVKMFVRQVEENPGERQRFLESMKKNRAERGKILRYKETKYQITPAASHRELLFMFTTEFEKGTFGEGFVVLVKDGEAKLDGYFQSDGPPAS